MMNDQAANAAGGPAAKLSARLTALADMVRPCARLIDVGTDHAYLPVYLMKNGRISAAMATDIAAGPIERAHTHVVEAGLGDLIITRQTPGLTGAEDFSPTDIVIAGMGGELIVSILDAAPGVHRDGINFILQPMTRQAVLRRYLASAGFEIIREVLVPEDGRVYQALCACYTGARGSLTPLEAEVGALNLASGGYALESLLSRKKAGLLKAVAGKKRGGEDASEDEELLNEITAYLCERTPFL